MLLKAIRLRHFRNLSQVHLTPHPRFNLLFGANGQGKTNLLEAIYILSALKSFRPQTTQTLIELGQPLATLEALVDRGGQERIVRIELGEKGRRVFLNESPITQLSTFFGTLNVVFFGPEDIALLKGPPSGRRRFIDRAIFNAHPSYASQTAQYDEILKQRNALLKAPSPNPQLLEVYDEQLIQYGAILVERRLSFLHAFRPVFERVFSQIFDPLFTAEIRYQSDWFLPPHPDQEEEGALPPRVEIERQLGQALEDHRHEARARGHTLVGPHRDDLEVTLNGMDARLYASQGQHRALVLAMKSAEITYLEERFNFAPILLLDDVSSELDRTRNKFLFDFLKARQDGQVFITTTHRDYILLQDHLTLYQVHQGGITPDDVEVVGSVENVEKPFKSNGLLDVEGPVETVKNLAPPAQREEEE